MPKSEAVLIRRRENATNFYKTMVEDGRSVGPQDRAENTQKACREHVRGARWISITWTNLPNGFDRMDSHATWVCEYSVNLSH